MREKQVGLCKFDGCERPAKTRGYCRTHYMQLWARGSEDKLTPIAPPPARVERMCAWCGVPLLRPPSHARSEFVYCNLTHKGLHKRALSEAMRGTCSVAGCDEPSAHVKPRLCKLHYGRLHQGRRLEGPRVWQKRGTFVCAQCGESFERPHAQARKAAQTFCSAACYHAWLTGRAPDRWTDGHGYVWLRISKMDDQRADFAREVANGRHVVPEHRLVMAEKIGRPLDRAEQVHHLNGTTTDNRPENLEIRRQGHHQELHADHYAEVRRLRRENEELRKRLALSSA